MTYITCRLTAKNRDQLRNPTLGSGVLATFTFLIVIIINNQWTQYTDAVGSVSAATTAAAVCTVTGSVITDTAAAATVCPTDRLQPECCVLSQQRRCQWRPSCTVLCRHCRRTGRHCYHSLFSFAFNASAFHALTLLVGRQVMLDWGASCIWPSWCHCHSLSLASVKYRMVYFSGTGLPRLSWKRGR